MKWNKRKKVSWITFAFCLCLCLIVALNVSANEQKIVDQADLLTAEEESILQERLEQISENYQCDVIVATTDSFEGKSRQDYTDDFYADEGYGYGAEKTGIILMVNLKEREFHYSTNGNAIRIFTDRILEQMDASVTPYLSSGDYAEAFLKYADQAEHYIEEAKQSGALNERGRFGFRTRIMIALVAGLAVTLIVVLALFMQLRSVSPNSSAREYIRQGSFHVTKAYEIFLYRNITKHRIEKESHGGGAGRSTTHSTSGGSRAGGRGGSF